MPRSLRLARLIDVLERVGAVKWISSETLGLASSIW